MNFRKNVKAHLLTNTLVSDQLNYSNSSGKLLASGNVTGESVEKGEFFADNVNTIFQVKFRFFNVSIKSKYKT